MPTTASDDRRLPDNADLENLKKCAKHFLKRIRSQDEDALERLRRVIPRSIRTPIALGDVQLVIAREYGFASWPKLKAFLETVPRNQVSSDVAGGPFEVPLIPLRDYIVFPGMEMPLYVGRSKSLSAIEAANQGQKVLLCLQRDAKTDDPQADDVYATGTLATIERTSATSAGAQVIVRGHSRARALHMEFSGSHAVAFVEPLADEQIDATEMNVAQMRSVLLRVVRKLNLPPELETEIEATFDPGKLVDLAAQHVPFGLPKRQELLELVNIRARLDRIVEMIADHQPTTIEDLAAARVSGLLWVGAPDHDLVGFALADEIDGNLHLDELAVDPGFARQGLGSALVETVCAEAKVRGCPWVTLRTFADIPWNGPFYLKLGFRECPDSAVTPSLWRLISEEPAKGLNVSPRIFMRREP